MSDRFTRAIVRPPSANFADGLTSVDLGAPSFEKALGQHAAYCAALRSCGLEVTVLAPDAAHPDATFVEDTAVLSERCNVLTRPGAPSREGEVSSMRKTLAYRVENVHEIVDPGTLDGGDICHAGNHFFIGVSHRTNWDGAAQLAAFLTEVGYTSSVIDIRATPGILHLKSGIAHLGDGRIFVIDALERHVALRDWHRVPVAAGEEYAANCVRVNDRLLVPAGFPRVHRDLVSLGYDILPLDMSEFQKMDGGLSCLSLRF